MIPPKLTMAGTKPKNVIPADYAFRFTVPIQFEFMHWRQRLAFIKAALFGKPVAGPAQFVVNLSTLYDMNKAAKEALEKVKQKETAGLTIVR